MTDRVCVLCGLPEQRTKDAKGRELVNLDPVSGKCIPCLAKSTMARNWPSVDRKPFDAKEAAAGKDAD